MSETNPPPLPTTKQIGQERDSVPVMGKASSSHEIAKANTGVDYQLPRDRTGADDERSDGDAEKVPQAKAANHAREQDCTMKREDARRQCGEMQMCERFGN